MSPDNPEADLIRGGAIDSWNPTERVDIIGIGVQKSATSWLFRCLAEHPEIRVAEGPGNKELNFFNHDHEKGYYWYHSRFAFGEWQTMEFSVLYFHDRNVPVRIRTYNPDAKLLLVLRNPIDRAYSQHKHEVGRDRIPPALYDFWDALGQNPGYIEQGCYARHLRRWLEHFDREQIHIVLYEDIRREPDRVLRETARFLEVDPDFQPELLDERVNVSYTYRNLELQRFLRLLGGAARALLGPLADKAIRASGLRAIVNRHNRIRVDDRTVPPLSEVDRKRLRALFAEDIRELGEITDRDLSHW